ncbi:hypothetical protein EU534_01485 [Candidatus Heimdallarchaeota archaeon]|nr:MAG: hypothetical protein EU534_01485 [Candidatus Heimdallarchaeota archaeon]
MCTETNIATEAIENKRIIPLCSLESELRTWVEEVIIWITTAILQFCEVNSARYYTVWILVVTLMLIALVVLIWVGIKLLAAFIAALAILIHLRRLLNLLIRSIKSKVSSMKIS